MSETSRLEAAIMALSDNKRGELLMSLADYAPDAVQKCLDMLENDEYPVITEGTRVELRTDGELYFTGPGGNAIPYV